MVSVTSSLCDLTIHLYTRLERVTVSKGMKEQLQSLHKSRDGFMVTFEHHAKVWRDLEREKEIRKEGPPPFFTKLRYEPHVCFGARGKFKAFIVEQKLR